MLRPSNELAENSGATCWPRTIARPQREHTIGDKPIGTSGCLRRAPLRLGLFGVGSAIVVPQLIYMKKRT